MNDKLERIWKEMVVAKSRCIHDIWLQELRKIIKNSKPGYAMSMSRLRSALVDTRQEGYRCSNSLGTEL
jgi:hypothetical protein